LQRHHDGLVRLQSGFALGRDELLLHLRVLERQLLRGLNLFHLADQHQLPAEHGHGHQRADVKGGVEQVPVLGRELLIVAPHQWSPRNHAVLLERVGIEREHARLHARQGPLTLVVRDHLDHPHAPTLGLDETFAGLLVASPQGLLVGGDLRSWQSTFEHRGELQLGELFEHCPLDAPISFEPSFSRFLNQQLLLDQRFDQRSPAMWPAEPRLPKCVELRMRTLDPI
jgi:hypothetical protein